jgi:integration host factor subunit alpha
LQSINYEIAVKVGHPGRNPKTGEDIPITAWRVDSFKAGQKLKAYLSRTASNN